MDVNSLIDFEFKRVRSSSLKPVWLDVFEFESSSETKTLIMFDGFYILLIYWNIYNFKHCIFQYEKQDKQLEKCKENLNMLNKKLCDYYGFCVVLISSVIEKNGTQKMIFLCQVFIFNLLNLLWNLSLRCSLLH